MICCLYQNMDWCHSFYACGYIKPAWS